ncbi:MAG: ATP-dependent dethiobiotin synthetase BioD [Actinobacteria bacterium]|nr:ATP-dependent dethiobiotin synthetase BioD [Actinomycetota bacterium]
MSLLIVSGTGTDVGKTVATAAVAALAHARGRRVAVVKPVQTGERPGAPGDLAAVAALTGLDDLHELARYPDPLSPEAAARTAGRPPLDLRRAADHIAALAADRDLVIVEGAGGLLVRYDPAGSTIADLAAMLDAPVLVVAAAGLGTLNHTALTLEALAARKLTCAGVVVGSWPADPGLAERCNLVDLAALADGPLAGLLPAGAGRLAPGPFTELASRSLGRALGGSFDVAAFRAAQACAADPRPWPPPTPGPWPPTPGPWPPPTLGR